MKKLKFFYQNTRGLRTKIAKGLRDRMTLANHDVIGLTETWLNDRFDSEGIFDDTYITYRSDKTNSTYRNTANGRRVNDVNLVGGGALIAIKKNISAIRMGNWESEIPFDNVWLKINTKNSIKIFVNCIYINHATNFERLNLYLKQLNEIVNIREPNSQFIIMGDFNLSCIEWYFDNNRCIALNHEGRLANELLNTLTLTDLKQMNYIKNQYNRILDLILTNIDSIKTEKTDGIVNEDPYHPALRFYLDTTNIKFMKNKKSPKNIFFRANFAAINEEINNVNWQSTFSNGDINDATNKFYQIINDLILKYVPKSKRIAENFPKWFSKKLIQLIHEKEHYFKMKKNTNNPIFVQLFNDKRKEIKIEKRKNLSDYQNNIESMISTNPKTFFSYTKSMRKSNNLPAMQYKNKISENMRDTTNLFAEYFSSVYTSTDSSNEFTCNGDCMNYFQFTENDVLNIIHGLDRTKVSSVWWE